MIKLHLSVMIDLFSPNPILQQRSTDCGLATLLMVGEHFGSRITIEEFEHRLGPVIVPWTGAELVNYADHVGLTCTAMQASVSDLVNLQKPCILHWSFDHFVVLRHHRGGRYTIDDPALGRLHLDRRAVIDEFTGVAFTFEPKGTPTSRRRLKASRHASIDAGSLVLLVLAGGLAMVTPLFIKYIMDEVIPSADTQLLQSLALLAIIFFAATPVLTGSAQLQLSRQGRRLGQRLFDRLLQSALPKTPHHQTTLPTSEKVLQLTQALPEVTEQTTHLTTQNIAQSLLVIVILFVVSAIDLVSALVLLLNFSSIMGFALLSRGRQSTLHGLTQASAHEHHRNIHESLNNRKLFYRFNATHQLFKRLRSGYSSHAGRILALKKTQQTSLLGQELANALSQGTLLYWTALQAIVGNLSLGGLFLILAYRAQLAQYGVAIANALPQHQLATKHLDRVNQLLPFPTHGEGSTGHEPDRRPNKQGPTAAWSTSCEEQPVWHAFSLPPEHEFDTLMDTLQRGERPTLPGVTEQTRKALNTLRSPIVGVSHKDPVFSASILANITLFEPTTDQTLLDRALELSQLRQWTDQLPMGIHEVINTQPWQFHPQFRLALLLARGLHQKPLSLLITLPEALTRDRSLNNILKRIHTAGVTILILKQ